MIEPCFRIVGVRFKPRKSQFGLRAALRRCRTKRSLKIILTSAPAKSARSHRSRSEGPESAQTHPLRKIGQPGRAHPAARLLNSGVSVRRFSAVDPLAEPVEHLGLNPTHSAWADLYPPRERPGLFQSGDVLRRVQDQLLELTLRKYPHHDVSWTKSIAMPWVTTIPAGVETVSCVHEAREKFVMLRDGGAHLVEIAVAVIDRGDAAHRA